MRKISLLDMDHTWVFNESEKCFFLALLLYKDRSYLSYLSFVTMLKYRRKAIRQKRRRIVVNAKLELRIVLRKRKVGYLH